MSFFDDTKKVGLALWIVGVLMILTAVLNIFFGLTDADAKADDTRFGLVIVGIGSLICALIFFGYGKSVRSGQTADKFAIVTKLILVVAMITIVTGIFKAISGVGFHDIRTYAIEGAILIVLGLVVLFIYRTVAGGNAGTFGKIMWIALLVIFVLMFIGTAAVLIKLNGGTLKLIVGAVTGICNLVIYLYMTVYLLDRDVRAKFGM